MVGMFWLAVTESCRRKVVDRIVAIVNDDVITLSELNTAFDPFMKKIEAKELPVRRRKR